MRGSVRDGRCLRAVVLRIIMHVVILFCVFGIAFANGESCSTPSGDDGKCILFAECEILKKVFHKPNRSPLDEHFLRQSRCGFERGLPKVCCPNSQNISCSTPEGNTGQCIDVKACPHLVEMLKAADKPDNFLYVKNSVCPGPEEHSACCGPPANLEEDPFYGDLCEKTVSAMPPDPNGDCCGVDSYVGNKIIGGNVTSINQYPWLVVIEYVKPRENNKLLCGGALISGKYVLTAAHCVKGPILREGTPKFVRLGEYDVTNSGPDCVRAEIGDDDCTDDMILAPIEEIIPHPDYDPYDTDRHHDVALIRLQIFAPYTDFIRPICLPNIDYILSPPTNFSFYVAGWGRYFQDIVNKKYRSSDVKMHVEVPYVLRSKCQASIRTLPGVEKIMFRDGQICAGGEAGKDSCKGDSGGPLMYENRESRKYELLGVVSAGAEICGQDSIPSLYTYVYTYLSWISNNIKP